MQTARRQTWISPEEYLAGELTAEVKYEYVDGDVYAMVGVTKAHAQITFNIGFALRRGGMERPCRALLSDVKVRVEKANAYYYPDVVVSCDPADRDPYVIHTPSVIVEVLSPTTEMVDRHQKRAHYQQIPSVREILLVAQEERRVEVYRRDGDGWMVETITEEGVVELGSVGVAMTLDDIYADLP